MTDELNFNSLFVDQQPARRAPAGGVGDFRSGLAYLFTPEIELAISAAAATQRPLLVTGPAGCGKSSLARSTAARLKWRYLERTVDSRTEIAALLWELDQLSRLQDANMKQLDPDLLAYVSQTTLSVDDTADVIEALKLRFPQIAEPKKGDICYATTNRQEAVKFMAPQVDLVIVVGSPNSSNSNRLREVAEQRSVPAYMVDSADDVQPGWIDGKRRVGVTAGASAPEHLVAEVVGRLRELGAVNVRELEGIEEHVTFPMPKGLAVL